MNNNKKFDVAIIGSGPGGYIAAIKASQLKKKVALIEKNELGGTCLNVGCIPTKTLLSTANLLNKLSKTQHYGINIKDISFDFAQIQKRKDKVVATLKRGLENILKANKIEIIYGKASFTSSKKLKIEGADNFSLTAEDIIIATGSEPLELSQFPFDDKFIYSSTSILKLTTLPQSIAIIGGGYIGCEFASFFNSLNTKVTIIEDAASILPHQDDSLNFALEKSFQKRGINIFTNTKATKIEKNTGTTLFLDNNTKINCDIILVAAGRKINTKQLNLTALDIKIDTNGRIITNEKMQTTTKNIYAIGDVTSKWMLAHVASHEGLIAAENIAKENKIMKYKAIPSVVFTSPEISSVGLSEKEAKEKGYDINAKTYPLSYLGRAQASLETEGFVKIIVDTSTKQILGAHMFGTDASTMISEMTLAINNGLTLECIIDTIHAHPTLSEAWFESALLANNTPLHHMP